jgi:hypothetical protein
VLHELPGDEGEAERRAVPVDRHADVDVPQEGEQVSLFVVECGESDR